MNLENLQINGYFLDENIVKKNPTSAYYTDTENEDNFIELHCADNKPDKIIALVFKKCSLDKLLLFQENDNIEKELNENI